MAITSRRRTIRVIAATLGATFAAVLVVPAAVAADTISVTAPSVVSANSKATIKLTTEDGDNDTARLWTRSTAGGQWIETSTTFTISDGVASAQVTVSTSRTYRVQTGSGTISSSFGIAMRDSSSRAVTANFTGGTYASGELSWIKGTAYKGGSTYKGATISIERAAVGSSTWKAIGSAKASTSTGNYLYRVAPSSSYLYRAVIKGTYARSAPIAIASTTSDRTLESRAASVASAIGSATGSPHSISSSDLPSGVNSARYQTFSSGTLIEVSRDSGVRTWVVYSKIGKSYTSQSRWAGKLGLPTRDAKCGLLEGGCVQRFTGGSVYQNDNKSSAYTAYGSVVETEIIAAAKSQVGYIEQVKHRSKYNTWVGSNYAWCSVFMGWAAAASGNSTMVPKRDTYAQFISTLKSSGVLHYSGTPPVGAIALFDWGSGTPSHSAIVRGHSGSYLYTVEGNTSNGKGGSARGVYERSRHISYVWAWFWPHDYAAS